MSLKDIDIRNKCPNRKDGISTGPCQDDQSIQADKGDLEGISHYGYVTHSGLSGQIIKGLTYDGRPLQIKNGKITTLFSKTYSELEKVTTYYYTKNNSNGDHINVPLIIRVRNKGGAYHLYINKGGDNTKWEKDGHTGDTIPAYNNTTEYFTKKLKELTCKLHRLHRVDLHKSDKDPPYDCDICSKAKVTVNKGRSVGGIYSRFLHNPRESTPYVTYKDNLVKYKKLNDINFKSLSVKKSDCDYLSVYYWNGDENRNNPLLMELKPTNNGQPTWYENIGTSGEKHDRWRKLEDEEGDKLSNETQLKEKLDSLSCILSGAVRISLGIDSACHKFPDHRHRDRLRTCSNGAFDRGLSIYSYEYTPRTESCENGLFHVSEFYLLGHKQEFLDGITFFKDVTKVAAYASFCDPTRPFLLCIESGNSGEKYKWYHRKTEGGHWEKKPQLKGHDPDTAKGSFGPIFTEAVEVLKIKQCETKSPPPSGIKIDITRKPNDGELFGVYNVDFGSDKIPILVTRNYTRLPNGFFRITHTANTATGSFTVSNALGNGDGIREGTIIKPINDVKEVEVYFWNGRPGLPILLGIKKTSNGNTKYYSRSEDSKTKQGIWVQRSYESQMSDDLEEMLDDQNCHRNTTIPIDLKDPKNLQRFYSKIPIPHLRKRSVKPLDTGPKLPQEARKDYEAQAYDVNSVISRLTYDNKGTDIDPPKGNVSQLRIYKWKNGPDPTDKVPLLVEFISSGKSEWYENLDKKSTNWASIGEEEVMSFYKNGPPPQYPYQFDPSFTKKLDEVSCRIHHTVKIDVSMKDHRKPYCHQMCKPRCRIKVKRETSNLFPSYTGYEHISSIQGQDKFTVTSIVNGNTEQTLEQSNLTFPLIEVSKVTVYFQNCERGAPVAMHIEKEGGNIVWLKNGGKNWKLKEFNSKDNIIETLNQATSGINLCPGSHKQQELDPDGNEDQEDGPQEEVDGEDTPLESHDSPEPTPVPPHSQQGVQEGSAPSLSSSTSLGTTDLKQKDFVDTSPQSPEGSQAAPKAAELGTGTPSHGSKTSGSTPYIITSSVLTASGSLTGFALWIYKRFAGEPWVRQI